MHPAIIIGTVRSLIVDVAMGQIPRCTERISSFIYFSVLSHGRVYAIRNEVVIQTLTLTL